MKASRVAAGIIAGVGTIFAAGYLFSDLARRRAERHAPATGRFLTIDGVRVHYVEEGSGPALLLIHGLGGQLRNFSYALLARLSRHHRVILLDRPGSGHSPRVRGYGIAEHAALVARFIEVTGLERPTVIGHSFGGAIALALALEHPSCIGRLRLIAPLSQPDMVVQQPFKGFLAAPPWLREAACRTTAVPLGAAIRHHVHKATFAPEPVAVDFDDAGGGILVLRAGALAAGFEEISTAAPVLARMAARYGELTVPTAILFGRQDQVLAPTIHGALTAAQIGDARLKMIEGGHMLPVTQPDIVADFIVSER